MSNRTLNLTAPLYDYLLSVSLREPALLQRLREETARDEMARMQVAPEQGQFMTWLVGLAGVRRALEIGVYTGYSTLCIARGLPASGRIIACDISESWTRIARRYWEEAGVGHRIDLRLAPAAETLASLVEEGDEERFDFAFIDADKANYDLYYERCLQLVRPGGLIVIDNVLWGGAVIDAAVQDADTQAIRALNAKLRDDRRVDISLLPVADGLSLLRKCDGDGAQRQDCRQ
ncbi:MAG: class I SAM-dependent methyltransferase [Gammaproteobacteria bacterium]|jgi:caffeoyl-CoA O-methyltransferase